MITLQQLQNFLPAQQIQTITSADGHQVQVSAAPNANQTTPIKSERLFVTPQMQPQVVNLQNLQGIPQQFIQVTKAKNQKKTLLKIISIVSFSQISIVNLVFSGWTNLTKCWQWNVSGGSTNANGYS